MSTVLVMSDQAAGAVLSGYTITPRVSSWLGEELLADDVPVESGTIEYDSSLRVPERATLRVPRLDRGTSWAVDADDHPLAPFGQQLHLSLVLDLAGTVELVARAVLVIAETALEGDTVDVEAVGLLQLIDEARFVAPYQPSGTFAGTLRSLVEPALTVEFSTALADRAVPTTLSWDEDRLGALHELLDAWPADAAVSAGGVLMVGPATDQSTPVLDLSDGLGGTVVSWAGQASRDSGRSVVVARGTAGDGGQLQAQVAETTGPYRLAGAFNPLPVPEFYFSPLLTTYQECQQAAATILRRRRRAAVRQLTATALPHPGLELGDLIRISGAGLSQAAAVVETLTLPLTAGDGPMSVGARLA